MKARNIIPALFMSLIAMIACEQMPQNNHDDLRQPKELNVLTKSLEVGWEGDTLDLSFKTNSYWGLDMLSWEQKVVAEGDTTRVMSQASWMTVPYKYGNGDAVMQVTVAANNRSTRSREGFIKVYTGDENVYTMVPVIQAGNPDYEGPEGLPPLTLVFDFTQNSMGWPTASQSVGEYVYPLDGVDYSFEFGRCNMGSYLVVHTVGAYLGLPAVENYRLTNVIVHISSNNAKQRGSLISADTAGTQVVGADQKWPASSGDVVYDLTGTEYNTRYYLFATESGLPVAGLTLTYEP